MFEDVIRNNRSVLDLLYGNYTFVNPVLAKHYGIPGVTGKNDRLGSGRRCGTIRTRRFAAHGRVPDPEFSGSENQSSQARVLGGAPAPGRGDSSSAPGGSGVAAGRSEDGCAVARRAGAASLESGCAPDAMRASTSSVWRWKGTDPWARRERRTWLAAPSTRQPPSLVGSRARASAASRPTSRRSARRTSSTTSAASCCRMRSSRTLQLSDDPVIEKMKTRLSAMGYRFDSLVETIVSSPQFLNRRRPESPRLHAAH